MSKSYFFIIKNCSINLYEKSSIFIPEELRKKLVLRAVDLTMNSQLTKKQQLELYSDYCIRKMAKFYDIKGVEC